MARLAHQETATRNTEITRHETGDELGLVEPSVTTATGRRRSPGHHVDDDTLVGPHRGRQLASQFSSHGTTTPILHVDDASAHVSVVLACRQDRPVG
jgi:hypothetical protein